MRVVHGLRVGPLRGRAAPPVATVRRPAGARGVSLPTVGVHSPPQAFTPHRGRSLPTAVIHYPLRSFTPDGEDSLSTAIHSPISAIAAVQAR